MNFTFSWVIKYLWFVSNFANNVNEKLLGDLFLLEWIITIQALDVGKMVGRFEIQVGADEGLWVGWDILGDLFSRWGFVGDLFQHIHTTATAKIDNEWSKSIIVGQNR